MVTETKKMNSIYLILFVCNTITVLQCCNSRIVGEKCSVVHQPILQLFFFSFSSVACCLRFTAHYVFLWSWLVLTSQVYFLDFQRPFFRDDKKKDSFKNPHKKS